MLIFDVETSLGTKLGRREAVVQVVLYSLACQTSYWAELHALNDNKMLVGMQVQEIGNESVRIVTE